jgi:hypothetical protein
VADAPDVEPLATAGAVAAAGPLVAPGDAGAPPAAVALLAAGAPPATVALVALDDPPATAALAAAGAPPAAIAVPAAGAPSAAVALVAAGDPRAAASWPAAAPPAAESSAVVDRATTAISLAPAGHASPEPLAVAALSDAGERGAFGSERGAPDFACPLSRRCAHGAGAPPDRRSSSSSGDCRLGVVRPPRSSKIPRRFQRTT